ncbi:serine protease [Methylococcus sp. EFPC2]|uniref:S1 family peptidase n=1 Tax=Methylococcus sp. EFPC2 TaxID=2812648 RepID=UPI001966D52C|nr:serine protease [Methylococcus sp. EFPC2]QSA95517.1 trypsin-like peptidase domain-containing protein [Methylococcus sp. EFPC2]
MRRSWLGVLGLVWALGGSADELPDTVARSKPSVVGVGTFQKTRSPPVNFAGTGFAVGDGQHVLTNAHVLPKTLDAARFESIAVFVREGGEEKIRLATHVASDEVHDIALLKIGGPRLPPLALGDSDKVREGETYAFTGYPIGVVLGLHPVTHRGIISAITPVAIPVQQMRQLNGKMLSRLNAPYDVFQLDATAYPGNSGSPLYDPRTGVVVGIINKVFVQETKENLLAKPSGISYAIPIKFALGLLGKGAQ